MGNLLLAGAGGALGSMARYWLSGAVQRAVPEALFPYGTLSVNLVGCLGIGLLAGVSEARGVLSGEGRVFLMIGVLGGFTTFSSFGYDTFQLLRDGQNGAALANAAVQMAGGLTAVWAGFVLSRLVS